MPRVKIDNKIVISFDYTAREKYWVQMSKYIFDKYGKGSFKDNKRVEAILLDAFNFLITEFQKIIKSEQEFTFFKYVFWLHEQSIELHVKILGGYKMTDISEIEFAMYRRILKLILEQGCDIDLDWGKLSSGNEVLLMDQKLQDLIYLGTWMYDFADSIAFQKMVDECHAIRFDEKGLLIVDWQHNYGHAYEHLFPSLAEDYEKGTFDEKAVPELIKKIEQCFKIDYSFAYRQILEIKKHHNAKAPNLETIEPHILSENLINRFQIPLIDAQAFYDGLTISRANKLSIEEAVLKPYSTKRYLFRPILVYNIGGKDRAIIGENKFQESIMVLATNALHWNAMLNEWLKLKCMQDFITKKGNEHDKILEDEIEDIVKSKGFLYSRNIKSFKQFSKSNIRIDNELAGEIDLIVVNITLRKIFIADAKYNRARYEAVGYRNDYSNFIKSYEPQLTKKIDWIGKNIHILQEHLSIIYNRTDIDLSGFDIEGIFIINTPTFYMFNGRYKAVTLKQIGDYLEGKFVYPILVITNDAGVQIAKIGHPYFRKPIQ
jgi:hypothetical protein